MSNAQGLDSMIRDLAEDLRPVGRLPPPALRAASWLGVVALIGVALSGFADVGATLRRLAATPDMSLAALGSTLTALLAAVAVFNLSLPDRKAAWAWLPLPGLMLWVGASGLGCLRDWAVAGTHAASMRESRDCLVFILGISLPVSALMIVMIRRAFTLRPNLTALMAGLASAAAAATLLNLVHPYDASATDLAVHLLAVGLVIGTHGLAAGRIGGR